MVVWRESNRCAVVPRLFNDFAPCSDNLFYVVHLFFETSQTFGYHGIKRLFGHLSVSIGLEGISDAWFVLVDIVPSYPTLVLLEYGVYWCVVGYAFVDDIVVVFVQIQKLMQSGEN